jgi:hypothetical protein
METVRRIEKPERRRDEGCIFFWTSNSIMSGPSG